MPLHPQVTANMSYRSVDRPVQQQQQQQQQHKHFWQCLWFGCGFKCMWKLYIFHASNSWLKHRFSTVLTLLVRKQKSLLRYILLLTIQAFNAQHFEWWRYIFLVKGTISIREMSAVTCFVDSTLLTTSLKPLLSKVQRLIRRQLRPFCNQSPGKKGEISIESNHGCMEWNVVYLCQLPLLL